MNNDDKPEEKTDKPLPSEEETAACADEAEQPVYQKPIIRKYGQLDRVTFS